MIYKPILTFLIAILLLIPLSKLHAQHTIIPVSSKEMLANLDKVSGSDQRLISGKFYHETSLSAVSGHPYSIDTEWKTGMVKLDNKTYNNLLLKFNVVSNTLVLNTRNLNNLSVQLCLKTEKIDEFILGEKKYISIPGNYMADMKLFYEVLAEGEINYLLLKSKKLEVSNNGTTNFEYKERLSNYLFVNNELIMFKRRRTLFKLYPELKSPLKKFISGERIPFGKINIEDRVKLINYCNSLISNTE